MLKLARISEPVLSPDGAQVAFTVQKVDLDKNTKPSQVYVVQVLGARRDSSPLQAARTSVRAGLPIRSRSFLYPTEAVLLKFG
jgi:dipeptidyl aminopeptidase/acylaminoacyl peptidase